jgi:hypothetical protein
MLILTQFIFRLSFGMALAMACTPARVVSSGYYRNNLYVLLGLNVLASLAAGMGFSKEPLPLWPPLTAAILSYLGGVLWLYELPRPGKAALGAISAVAIVGAWMVAPGESASPAAQALKWCDPLGGGLVSASRWPPCCWGTGI